MTVFTAWEKVSAYCGRQPILCRVVVAADGRVMLIQWPNLALWAAIYLGLLTRVTTGTFSRWTGHLGMAAMAYWAILEIGWGVTLFRRGLGLFVLGGILMTLWAAMAS